jgi:8-oxo-dGTP diphosphatase
MRRFPTGKYGRQTLTFYPAPFRAPIRAFASLVFPFQERRVLICDITDRGWCIPSGRVEAFESSLETALREAVEEGGAILTQVQYIGCYQIRERNEMRWADCFAGLVQDLVEIGITEESRARRFVALEELPELYHNWNPLTELVFRHAYEVQERHDALRFGANRP